MSPSSSCLARKKSIDSFYSDFSTCLLILSTESLSTLKTFSVPSMSITLLPIAIMMVPKNTHDFSSISGLFRIGALKSIFSNSKESLEARLLQLLYIPSSSGVMVFRIPRLLCAFVSSCEQKWQCGQFSSLFLSSSSSFSKLAILRFIKVTFYRRRSLLSCQCFLDRLEMGFAFKKEALIELWFWFGFSLSVRLENVCIGMVSTEDYDSSSDQSCAWVRFFYNFWL